MQESGREDDQAQPDHDAGRETAGTQPGPSRGPGGPEGPGSPGEGTQTPESPERPGEGTHSQGPPAGSPENAAGRAAPARWSRPGRLTLGAGAAVAAAVVAAAAFAAAGGLSGPGPASSVIPSPPRQNKMFVADDDGTGADNQANFLRSAAPGLVHVVTPRGTPAGAGLILTPSGLVLTSDQALQGAARASVRVVLSGRSFRARLVGTDPAHGLALLQAVGRAAFRPVAVGNSRYLRPGAAVTAVGSSGLTKTFTLNIGNVTSRSGTVAAGGRQLTGLLVSTTRVVAGEETGGPLVNLSGQAVGINVAGTGAGLHHTGFAVPIDEALAVARQIQAAHSG